MFHGRFYEIIRHGPFCVDHEKIQTGKNGLSPISKSTKQTSLDIDALDINSDVFGWAFRMTGL